MIRFEVRPRRRARRSWALLLIVVGVAAGWGVLVRERAARSAGTGDVSLGDVVPAARYVPGTVARTAEVERFVAFVTADQPHADDDSTASYAASGLRLLAGALRSLAPRDSTGARMFQPQLDSLGEYAREILAAHRTTAGARLAREAFGLAGEVLAELQRRRFPVAADEVMHARRAAWGLVDTRVLPGQDAAVQRFFERVADALHAMTT